MMFEFSFFDFDQFNISQADRLVWHPATLPGDSIRHLLDAGIETGDPNQFDNTQKFFKYEAMDFAYRTRFEVGEGKHYRFACDGLDTIADIYLNGVKIHESRTAFIRLDLDLTAQVKLGSNELLIHFVSPTEFIKQHRPDFEKQELRVLFDEKWRAYLRKPQWHYGWNNVGHLAGVGFIGVPKLIESVATLHVSDLLFDQQYDWKTKYAEFKFRIDATVYQACTICIQLGFAGKTVWESDPAVLDAGTASVLDLPGGALADVQEWNCVGMGDPNLYDLRVVCGGKTVYEHAVGFRHVELSRKVVGTRTMDYRVGAPEEEEAAIMDGGADISTAESGELFNGAWSHLKVEPYETEVEDFCLVLNGRRVFIEGFDWQPVEYNLSNVAPEKLRDALEKMAALNVNSVRIWGGAYIEDRAFYDFCDQNGIVVWQDFLFACSLYPDHDEFFRSLIRTEVDDIVKRLHNHASLGVYCGSNEIDMMLHDMDMDTESNNTIGHELIPETLHALECPIPYHVSSPAAKEYPRHPFSGECRNWSAMTHIGDDYVALRKDENIMVSEGGCAAYPRLSETELFIRPEWELQEEVLLEHLEYQIHAMSTYRHQHFIKTINIHQAIRNFFGSWENLGELVYLSQLYQAQGLRRYTEIFRHKQQSMHGYYVWKFAASWPCLCLCILDYRNIPKMAYHRLKQSMGDLTIAPYSDETGYTFSVFSRYFEEDLELSVQTCTFDGEVLDETVEDIARISRGINHNGIAVARSDLKPYDLSEIVLVSTLRQNGQTVYERLFFPQTLNKMKAPHPEVEVSMSECGRKGGRFAYEVTLSTKTLMMSVNIRPARLGSPPFDLDENVFDMLPGTERTLALSCENEITGDEVALESYNHVRHHCRPEKAVVREYAM